jgi:hypothetical protein
VTEFRSARERLERQWNISIDRRLGDEISLALQRNRVIDGRSWTLGAPSAHTGSTQMQGPGGSGGPMVDKSPHRTNDKKRGKTLQEKRAAKRQKRAERQAAERARDIAEGA